MKCQLIERIIVFENDIFFVHNQFLICRYQLKMTTQSKFYSVIINHLMCQFATRIINKHHTLVACSSLRYVSMTITIIFPLVSSGLISPTLVHLYGVHFIYVYVNWSFNVLWIDMMTTIIDSGTFYDLEENCVRAATLLIISKIR